MRRSKFRRPCKVLIFNGARVLVAIVRSLHCAAELTHENKSAIHNCCTGKSVRSGAYYYRQLHPDILLEMDDLPVQQLCIADLFSCVNSAAQCSDRTIATNTLAPLNISTLHGLLNLLLLICVVI